ncbi:hypothetical protein N7535_002509 [Penicillium sp. DV-2018c]|nr:hypothetical protein N7461_001805 [Penicillium sp. DV-2018c]KAJ5575583.1 hypothetical protein N7535_002509 [Penicillium sp. DV-2018c]
MAMNSHPSSLQVESEAFEEATVILASFFRDQSNFEAHILGLIQGITRPSILVCKDVKPTWGQAALQAVDEVYRTRKSYDSLRCTLRIMVMPTEIHDVPLAWWHQTALRFSESGDCTDYELRQLDPGVGTTLEFRHGPYQSSRKEPDFFMRTSADTLPSFAIESGWSETYNDLLEDMNMLLVGGNGHIKAVVILNWLLKRSTSVVSGFAELYVRDRNEMPIRRQHEAIFPAPPQNPTAQRLTLTRLEFFGPSLVPDPDRTAPPNPNVFLSIEQLRAVALVRLARMNLTAAV